MAGAGRHNSLAIVQISVQLWIFHEARHHGQVLPGFLIYGIAGSAPGHSSYPLHTSRAKGVLIIVMATFPLLVKKYSTPAQVPPTPPLLAGPLPYLTSVGSYSCERKTRASAAPLSPALFSMPFLSSLPSLPLLPPTSALNRLRAKKALLCDASILKKRALSARHANISGFVLIVVSLLRPPPPSPL